MKIFFTTTDELGKVVPVMQSFDFELVQADVELVQNKYLLPILGKEFLNEFWDLYDDTIAVDEDDVNYQLLQKIQGPLAHLALFHYIDKGNVSIGSSGVQQSHQQDGNKPAFQWAKDEAKQSYFDTGMDGLDMLETFLLENKADFATWAASDAYAKAKEFFLNTTEEFQNEFNINSSRRTFIAVKHVLKRHDTITVKKVIGTDLFDEIKQQIYDENISAANATLLRDYIRPGLVHLTVSDSIAELILKIDGMGITVNTPQRTGREGQSRNAAPDDNVNNLWKKEKTLGMDYLAALKDYLQANGDDYPLYTVISEYTRQYKNTQDSGLAIL